jgi:hypothetical protein
MADNAYAKLLERFSGSPEKISDELGANIMAFYGPTDGPPSEEARAVLTVLRSRQK